MTDSPFTLSGALEALATVSGGVQLNASARGWKIRCCYGYRGKNNPTHTSPEQAIRWWCDKVRENGDIDAPWVTDSVRELVEHGVHDSEARLS